MRDRRKKAAKRRVPSGHLLPRARARVSILNLTTKKLILLHLKITAALMMASWPVRGQPCPCMITWADLNVYKVFVVAENVV